jgi:hypothetical protein
MGPTNMRPLCPERSAYFLSYWIYGLWRGFHHVLFTPVWGISLRFLYPHSRARRGLHRGGPH